MGKITHICFVTYKAPMTKVLIAHADLNVQLAYFASYIKVINGYFHLNRTNLNQ